jgi:hypothetical protein
MRALLVVLAFLVAAPLFAADVVVLLNGDRVSGKVIGRIAKRVRVQTPYGTLIIPADKVERILRNDGSTEVLNAPPTPEAAPAPPPPPPPATLVVVVSGDTFWQAWDPKAAPADPSLRMEVRLDGRPVASYTDVNLDPEDLPKAVVNSFVFSPKQLFVNAADTVTAAGPELVSGEIRLPISLPPDVAGHHELRLAYQVNDGTSSAPQWRDVTLAAGEIDLASGSTTRVRVQQERGTMQYSGKKMRNVETFRATVTGEDQLSAP